MLRLGPPSASPFPFGRDSDLSSFLNEAPEQQLRASLLCPEPVVLPACAWSAVPASKSVREQGPQSGSDAGVLGPSARAQGPRCPHTSSAESAILETEFESIGAQRCLRSRIVLQGGLCLRPPHVEIGKMSGYIKGHERRQEQGCAGSQEAVMKGLHPCGHGLPPRPRPLPGAS